MYMHMNKHYNLNVTSKQVRTKSQYGKLLWKEVVEKKEQILQANRESCNYENCWNQGNL